MADEVTAGEIRTRQFDVVRKGYDRSQVESFLALVARFIDTFEARLAEASEDRLSVGLDDPEALAKEMEKVGAEVAAILEAARFAAEGMRSRSVEDAEQWKATAEAEIAESLSEAARQAQAMREAAWVEGTAILESAIAEAALIIDETERDSLRMRAEAEREAIRYSSDSRRTSEEAVAAAENEADAIVARARDEGESVMAVANQSVDLAQERVRALEDEHVDLLGELETARSSIGDLDTEIESRKHDLEEPDPEAMDDTRSHHGADGGSVRIVSGSKVVPLKPVDADSFVAEVAALHMAEDRGELSQQSPVSAVADLPPDETQPEQVPASTDPTADVHAMSESESPPDAPSTDDAVPPEPVAVDEVSTDDSQPGPEAESEPEGELTAPMPPRAEVRSPDDADDDSQEANAPKVDSIGSLFAQLRESSAQSDEADAGSSEAPAASADGDSSPDNGGEKLGTIGELADHTGADDMSESPETVDELPPPDSLIPVQNAALRSIKRALVDLQNDSLEHLRTDKDWMPQEDYTDRFGETFAELASAITGDTNDGGAASAFAADLYDSVSTAVMSSRAAGSGDRAIASATSKVYRTWRSDEAERRVVAVAAELAADPVEA